MNSSRKKRFCGRIVCAALIVGVAFVCGCEKRALPKQANSAESAPSEAVAVGVVKSQLLEKSVILPATIESDETAMLMPRVEAYVGEVLVDIGDEVEAGQLLIRLSAPELGHEVVKQQARIRQLKADEQVLAAEVRAARTQLDVAQAELTLKNSERDRLAGLVDTGAIDRQRLEEADSAAQSTTAVLARYGDAVEVAEAKLLKGEAEMAVVEAELNEAATLAGYLEIKAPFAGLVASREVDPGNLVRPASSDEDDDALLTIAKVETLRAVVHATVDVAGRLVVGVPVKFVADDLPGETFTSTLSRTAGTYDPKTRMMRAEIDIENPRVSQSGDRLLRSGSYGSAEFITQSATLPVVPQSALLREEDRVSVVVVRDGVCVVTPVKVAFEADGLAGIETGVEAGAQIVAETPAGVQENQELTDRQIRVVAW